MHGVFTFESASGPQIETLPGARDHGSSLDHGVCAKALEVLHQDEIGAVTGTDGTAIDEPVVSGRDKGRMPDRRRGRDTGGHDAPQQPVQVTMTPEIVGKDIVGAQAPRVVKLASR